MASVPVATGNDWRRGEVRALLVLFTALFALVGRGTFFSSDEGGIFNTNLSLVQRQALDIGPGENVHQGRDGRYYSCRELLPTGACVLPAVAGTVVEGVIRPGPPPAALGGSPLDRTNWPIFLTVTILGPLLTAGTLVYLGRFVLLEGGSRRDAVWLMLVAGWATPLAVYSKTIFPQVFETLFLMAAFEWAARWRRHGSLGMALMLGSFCGYGVMTRATFAPVCLWFLGYLLLTGPVPWQARLRAAALFAALVTAGAGIVAWYNWYRWGSPFDFGYHSDQETFTTPLHVGLYGLLLSPGKGLLVYAPVMLLPLLFGRVLWRRGYPEVVLALGITATYLVVYGRWYDWPGGLSWGPRFLLALIPMWLALFGRALSGPSARTARQLLLVAGMVGFAVQVVGLTVHPQWMNLRGSDAFALTHNHLVEMARVLFEQGPNDLWLLSRGEASLAVYAVLVLLFGGAALLAARGLAKRAKPHAA